MWETHACFGGIDAVFANASFFVALIGDEIPVGGEAGDPIARVKRYLVSEDDELFCFADVRYRGDSIQYEMNL